jgi:hypothetical protein
MDTTHNWALWRMLMIALIVLPFIVTAILSGLGRQRGKPHSEAAGMTSRRVDATHGDESATPPAWGPGVWAATGGGRIEMHLGRAAVSVVDKRAA